MELRKTLLNALRRLTKKKAAPRFELGIKDLQSSALPLGHAATRERSLPSDNDISPTDAPILFVCNGHGEDLIALRILEAIHKRKPLLQLEVLPLVGKGDVFNIAIEQGWLSKIGPLAALPSGGFSNQNIRGLIADLINGLPLLSWRQLRLVIKKGNNGYLIFAIGDLFPLLIAWSSSAPFGFIGTPKSDYTWRSGPGSSISDCYHQLKRSEWDPWEWFLMRSHRCKLVATRDRLTARGLNRRRVPAISPGNPMMDGFVLSSTPPALERCRRVLLLCGSRMPEAGLNFDRLLSAAIGMSNNVPIALLVTVGSQPPLKHLENILKQKCFRRSLSPSTSLKVKSCWVYGSIIVLIGIDRFYQWASWAEAGIATAGTATEQLVGLGIPALSLPGKGPQFQWNFARRQSRLLGGAVIPCASNKEMRYRLKKLLADKHLRHRLGTIGIRRMGSTGGSDRLAELIISKLKK